MRSDEDDDWCPGCMISGLDGYLAGYTTVKDRIVFDYNVMTITSTGLHH